MVIISPPSWGYSLSKWPNWLINGGDPNYLHPLGWSTHFVSFRPFRIHSQKHRFKSWDLQAHLPGHSPTSWTKISGAGSINQSINHFLGGWKKSHPRNLRFTTKKKQRAKLKLPKIKTDQQKVSQNQLVTCSFQLIQFPSPKREIFLFWRNFHGRTFDVSPVYSAVYLKLAGGFKPSEIYLSNWKSSPNRGEHRKYLKPPPSKCWKIWFFVRPMGLQIPMKSSESRIPPSIATEKFSVQKKPP